MTVKIIKVTKKDRVCYARVPEPVERGDKLEVLYMREEEGNLQWRRYPPKHFPSRGIPWYSSR